MDKMEINLVKQIKEEWKELIQIAKEENCKVKQTPDKLHYEIWKKVAVVAVADLKNPYNRDHLHDYFFRSIRTKIFQETIEN